MKEKAIQYYRQGYNCAQCILKAAEYRFHIPFSKQSLNACEGISSGFGIGGICSVLIAGVMIFGILFDETTVKELRLLLLDEFQKKFGSLNCGAIARPKEDGDNCFRVVGEGAEIIEGLILSKRKSLTE